MLVKISGHEIVEADITKISLVKRGANRAPFKIQKSAEPYATPSPKVIGIEPGNNASLPDSNPLNLIEDHSFEGMFRHAHARKYGRGW